MTVETSDTHTDTDTDLVFATPDPSDRHEPAHRSPIGLQYLGHATVLLDLPGIRILTDPFLRSRLGPLRRHGPTPEPGAIGSVDVVEIGRAHV